MSTGGTPKDAKAKDSAMASGPRRLEGELTSTLDDLAETKNRPESGTAPRHADELAPGTELGEHYRVERCLGRGAMGAVYVVEHTGLGKKFAAKVVAASHATDPDAVTRLRNEARSLSAVDHENIVSVTHLGQTADGRLFVVMELLEGENLGDRLARQRLRAERSAGPPWLGDDEVRTFIPQILHALSTAHGAGVVHRDLKPDNLFLATKGNRNVVKVVDFGISKFEARGENVELTQTGQILGTPLYMAPEQGKSTATVDARADIYSFGCIVYQMLTGRPPFLADSVYECVVMHATEEAQPPSAHRAEITPEIDAVVLNCLEKRPDDRFQSANDVLAAWQAAWGEGDASAEKLLTDTAKRMRDRRAVKKPRRTGVWIAAAAALLGVAGWLAYGRFRIEAVIAEPDVALPPAASEMAPAFPIEAAEAPAPTPAAPEIAPRHLASDPAGAEVFESGERLGTTPLTVDIPLGATRTVELRLPGYVAESAALRADGPDQIVVTLERAAPRARRVVPKLAPR